MRVPSYILVILLVVGLTGCTRESELEKQNADLQQKNIELSRDLATRDQYIEDIVSSINNVYSDLERARAKEKMLLKEAESREKTKVLSSVEVRQQVLKRIADIGGVLQTNRKRIADLQSKLRSSQKQFESLEQMVASLKQNLEEREQVIARLEKQLEEKSKELAERDSRIQNQLTEMNTAYYIIGTREELEEKGIIENEGGFLWGLFGSTTILASGVEEAFFNPINKNAATTLTVEGEIDEIIPKRSQDYYQTDSNGDESTVVKIVDPKKFWQEKYLVIITG